MTKEDIGLELQRWLAHDAPYCYTLVAYAHQEGVITEQECLAAKEELDKIYAHDKAVHENRGKFLITVFKQLGMTKTRVLWNLIEQFPNKFVGDPAEGWMRPDHEKIYKDLGITSIDYYSILADIQEYNYLEKKDENRKMYYKINFEKIMQDYENETI